MLKEILNEFEKFGQKYKDKVIIFDLESWENFKEELNKFVKDMEDEE